MLWGLGQVVPHHSFPKSLPVEGTNAKHHQIFLNETQVWTTFKMLAFLSLPVEGYQHKTCMGSFMSECWKNGKMLAILGKLASLKASLTQKSFTISKNTGLGKLSEAAIFEKLAASSKTGLLSSLVSRRHISKQGWQLKNKTCRKIWEPMASAPLARNWFSCVGFRLETTGKILPFDPCSEPTFMAVVTVLKL